MCLARRVLCNLRCWQSCLRQRIQGSNASNLFALIVVTRTVYVLSSASRYLLSGRQSGRPGPLREGAGQGVQELQSAKWRTRTMTAALVWTYFALFSAVMGIVWKASIKQSSAIASATVTAATATLGMILI